MKLSRIFVSHKTKSGFWFRIFGRGLSVNKEMSFSMRNGYKKYLTIMNYNITWLPRTSWANDKIKEGTRVYVICNKDWEFEITSYGRIIKWNERRGVYDIYVDKHLYRNKITGQSFCDDYGFNESHYAAHVKIEKD
jgi:hypothetical protein